MPKSRMSDLYDGYSSQNKYQPFFLKGREGQMFKVEMHEVEKEQQSTSYKTPEMKQEMSASIDDRTMWMNHMKSKDQSQKNMHRNNEMNIMKLNDYARHSGPWIDGMSGPMRQMNHVPMSHWLDTMSDEEMKDNTHFSRPIGTYGEPNMQNQFDQKADYIPYMRRTVKPKSPMPNAMRMYYRPKGMAERSMYTPNQRYKYYKPMEFQDMYRKTENNAQIPTSPMYGMFDNRYSMTRNEPGALYPENTMQLQSYDMYNMPNMNHDTTEKTMNNNESPMHKDWEHQHEPDAEEKEHLIKTYSYGGQGWYKEKVHDGEKRDVGLRDQSDYNMGQQIRNY